jgi:hypothetical protein
MVEQSAEHSKQMVEKLNDWKDAVDKRWLAVGGEPKYDWQDGVGGSESKLTSVVIIGVVRYLLGVMNSFG